MRLFSIKKTIFAQTFRTKCGEERQLLYTRRLLRYVFDFLKLRNFQCTCQGYGSDRCPFYVIYRCMKSNFCAPIYTAWVFAVRFDKYG